jgi:hypothetical protein
LTNAPRLAEDPLTGEMLHPNKLRKRLRDRELRDSWYKQSKSALKDLLVNYPDTKIAVRWQTKHAAVIAHLQGEYLVDEKRSAQPRQ